MMRKVAARLRSRNNPGKGNSECKGHRPAVAGNRRHGKKTSVAGAQEGRVGRGGVGQVAQRLGSNGKEFRFYFKPS